MLKELDSAGLGQGHKVSSLRRSEPRGEKVFISKAGVGLGLGPKESEAGMMSTRPMVTEKVACLDLLAGSSALIDGCLSLGSAKNDEGASGLSPQ